MQNGQKYPNVQELLKFLRIKKKKVDENREAISIMIRLYGKYGSLQRWLFYIIGKTLLH